MTLESNDVVRRLSARLKMRHLVLLLQIQQHGTLTRVAEQMASSQPAVTNALAELESMFGMPLFERSPRGMTPTALGVVVLERARAMIHDLDHLARDMTAVASGYATHLHVGVIPFISGQLLAAALKRLHASMAQRVTVTIHEGTSDQLLPQLRDHTVDIVIGRAAASVDLHKANFEILFRQRPRMIASRRLAAKLARAKLDWNRLVTLDWILGAPHTPIREQVADLFLAAGTTPPVPVVESYSSKLIGEMIASSEDAVSIVPSDIAEELVRIAGVAIVPYSFEWTLPPIALFTRAEGPRSAAQDRFVESIRQLCVETYAETRD
ncbi:LysR substrate-binding domain-containing protein [Paraburkholderia rhizosphaerae]|uniref:LysR family transcriptional regulator n=1 Tax=Paraburkholderia rhizosphaerae TaxID=480658 RepID=A0A4R8LWB2_9BURK|nr:LysR substrate-binding domain-containing protein [Paraburkholderia rhizosphaerae]TDY52194.1 LysR family transcriptional regulator [Paraburkholderia rhizosphaerae]